MPRSAKRAGDLRSRKKAACESLGSAALLRGHRGGGLLAPGEGWSGGCRALARIGLADRGTPENVPFIGRKRADLKYPGVRSWRVEQFTRWLIFYGLREDALVLYRVRSGTMNLAALKLVLRTSVPLPEPTGCFSGFRSGETAARQGPTWLRSIGRKPIFTAGEFGWSRKSFCCGATKSGSATSECRSWPRSCHFSQVQGPTAVDRAWRLLGRRSKGSNQT